MTGPLIGGKQSHNRQFIRMVTGPCIAQKTIEAGLDLFALERSAHQRINAFSAKDKVVAIIANTVSFETR